MNKNRRMGNPLGSEEFLMEEDLLEQYVRGQEDEEEKMRQHMQKLRDAFGGEMPPNIKDKLGPTEVQPLETGQPGAISANIGWKDLASIAKPQGGKPPMPPMGGQRPPMGGQKPPMGGMPPMPNMDDQPGLPAKPRTPAPQGGMPPMGGPPAESDGPRSMEPSDDFAQRMGIDPHQRHHLRPKEDSVPIPPGADGGPPGSKMPEGPPPQQRSLGPEEGQPVRPELADQPAAPKEMPQRAPGTTEGSQDFINKYASQIKSVIKTILDKEKEKFALGKDLTAMPKNFKESYYPSYLYEQANNAVGGGMSPVVGGEGEIEGRDKMLGKTGDKQNKFNMMSRANDALDIMAQRIY